MAKINAVVEGRKTTAAFYSSDADAWKSNQSHRFVIEIYTALYELLGGKDSVLIDGPEHKVPQDNELLEGVSSANEWLINTSAGASAASGRTKNSTSKTKYHPLDKYQLHMDEEIEKDYKGEEETFAAMCFYRDMNVIRQYVSAIWKQVEPSGQLSRITAGIISNQAVGVVKALEYELLHKFPAFKDPDTLYMCLIKKVVNNQLHGDLSFDVGSYGLLHDTIMSGVNWLLRECAHSMKSTGAPRFFTPVCTRKVTFVE